MKPLLVALPLACMFSLTSVAGPIDILNEYNLIVFGDLKSTSEVEGKTIVYGDINGTASNYGIHLSTASSAEDALILGGNNNSTLNINNGYGVAIGGTDNGTINLNGGGAQTNSTAAYNLTQIQADLLTFSSDLQALTANSILTTPTASSPGQPIQPGPATFNVGSSLDPNYAVFDITADEFFGNDKIQQYDLNFNGQSPTSVVINVGGTTVTDDGGFGNAVGSFNDDSIRELIIWNFYEATSINLTKQLNGSLLAPLADLMNITPIEGSVVVNNFMQDGEIHDPTFNGFLDLSDGEDNGNGGGGTTAIPEPSMVITALLGLVGLCLRRQLKA